MKRSHVCLTLVLVIALSLMAGPAQAFEIPLIPIFTIPPIATPTPTIRIVIPDLPLFTIRIPTATPKPTIKIPPLTLIPIPFPDPKPTDNPMTPPTDAPTDRPRSTPRPNNNKSGGQTLTSEGPPFLSFRTDLTQEFFMFTPMDLSVDGEYHFPLVADGLHTVGEAKVVVKSGMVVVSYLVVNGVKVDEKNEFFTFFPDIRSVPSVLPKDLQAQKLQFGMPYSVQAWLGSDSKVLLYINCPVSYKTNLADLTTFSFMDAGYLERLAQLTPLMD